MGKLSTIEGEEVRDSWAVYRGKQGPTTAKITGRLYVTDKSVIFKAGLHLEKDAAATISNRVFPGEHQRGFESSDQTVIIPFSEIEEVYISTKFLFLKSLNIKFRSGEELSLHFGALSPRKALEAISTRLKN